MIRCPVEEVPTPSLLLDLEAAERNIARMATALTVMPADIRPHIKVHKCGELASRQIAAGAIGLSVATVLEAVALAWDRCVFLLIPNDTADPDDPADPDEPAAPPARGASGAGRDPGLGIGGRGRAPCLYRRTPAWP